MAFTSRECSRDRKNKYNNRLSSTIYTLYLLSIQNMIKYPNKKLNRKGKYENVIIMDSSVSSISAAISATSNNISVFHL